MVFDFVIKYMAKRKATKLMKHTLPKLVIEYDNNIHHPAQLKTLVDYIIDTEAVPTYVGCTDAVTDFEACLIALRSYSRGVTLHLNWDYSDYRNLTKVKGFAFYNEDQEPATVWLDEWARYLIAAPAQTLRELQGLLHAINDVVADEGYSTENLFADIAGESPRAVYRFLKDYSLITTDLYNALYQIYIQHNLVSHSMIR